METTRFLPIELLVNGPYAEILLALFAPAALVACTVCVLGAMARRPLELADGDGGAAV